MLLTSVIKTRGRIFSFAAGLLLLTCLALFLYPEIVSLSTHPLATESNTLNVNGVYWKIPLASVDSVSLRSGELIVRGRYFRFLGAYSARKITRAIPATLDAASLQPDNGWTIWQQSDAMHYIIGQSIWRTIFNLHTGQKFSYALPFVDYFEILRFYHGRGDTSVAVFAFGKSGQDEQSLMGYILITSRGGK